MKSELQTVALVLISAENTIAVSNSDCVLVETIARATELYQQNHRIYLSEENKINASAPKIIGLCEEIFVRTIIFESLLPWSLSIERKVNLLGKVALMGKFRFHSVRNIYGCFSAGIHIGEKEGIPPYSITDISFIAEESPQDYFPGERWTDNRIA